MSDLIAGSRGSRTALIVLGSIGLFLALAAGMHVLLNLGRYVGSIVRYAATGDICFL